MTLTKPDVTTSLAGKWKCYPVYKDSGVEWLGEIPEHWEVRRLKYIAKFLGGGTPPRENIDFWSGDIPWVSPKDMKAEIVYDAEDHITEYAIEHSATRLIQPGAVLIVVRSGILRHSIPVAINVRPIALNQDMKALITEHFLRAEYLASLIRGHVRALLVEWRKEGATVESIEFELLVNTPCPIPPLPEQQAITAFLDLEITKINALIAKKERLVELLQEKRAALISQAVTKGLDPTVPMKDSGVEWLGKIPGHWEVKRLKFVADVLTGVAKGRDLSDRDVVELPYLRVANVQDGYLDLSDVATIMVGIDEVDRYSLQRGDVLMNEGGDFDKLGRGYVWEGTIAPCLHQNHVFAVRAHMWVNPYWISMITLTSYAKHYFILKSKQSTNLASISATNLKELPVLMPPKDEQDAILGYIKDTTAKLDALISRIREGVEKLKEYSTALISAAVTGKIDVRGEDERVGVS